MLAFGSGPATRRNSTEPGFALAHRDHRAQSLEQRRLAGFQRRPERAQSFDRGVAANIDAEVGLGRDRFRSARRAGREMARGDAALTGAPAVGWTAGGWCGQRGGDHGSGGRGRLRGRAAGGIEPVTSSRLRSSVLMRAARRSRSAASARTASLKLRCSASWSNWRFASCGALAARPARAGREQGGDAADAGLGARGQHRGQHRHGRKRDPDPEAG